MKFWVLSLPMMTGDFAFADVIDPEYGDAPQCSSCGEYIGSLKWLPPHRIRLVKGMKSYAPGDIISGPGCEAMMSDRFIDAFERSGLKGIEHWEPVIIEGYNNYWEKELQRPAPAARFKVAVFPRPTVRVVWEAMHPEPIDEAGFQWVGCAVCGRNPTAYTFRGLVVEEDSWNGADIFHFSNIGGVFGVTEAFGEFVAKEKFRGVPLVPAEEYKPFKAQPATW